MAEIINLRLARKARRRAVAGKVAAENRARHGQPRHAREQARSESERADRTLDGARLEPAPPSDEVR